VYSTCRLAVGVTLALLFATGCGRREPAPVAEPANRGEVTLVDTLFALAEDDDIEGVKELLSRDTVASLEKVFVDSRGEAAGLDWPTLLAVLRRMHRPTCAKSGETQGVSYEIACTNLKGEFKLKAILQDEVWRLQLPDPQALLNLPKRGRQPTD